MAENLGLEVFDNPEFGTIRVLDEDGKYLFCGLDVAKALGYEKPRNAISTHCKGALKRGVLTKGGMQEMMFIPEGDVYRLASHSHLPSAEKFERWVFDTVLPSIRKTGGYIAGEEHMDDDELMARALLVANKKIELRNQEIKKLKSENAVLQPKAEYYDDILQSPTLIQITQIAKDFGLSGRGLNKLLLEWKIIYRKRGKEEGYYLTQKYAAKGYAQSYTYKDVCGGTHHHLKWTELGRKFLYDVLISKGYKPASKMFYTEQQQMQIIQ